VQDKEERWIDNLYHHDIQEIDDLIMRFVKWYYEAFYLGKQQRLPACKYTISGLLHLPDNLRNWGSASFFWQYAEVLNLASKICCEDSRTSI
jgi:hypothetical protein